jgi:hypothetical protein
MAFDFLGTFNAAQYERLSGFIRSQVKFVEARVNHLEAEKIRVGQVIFRFDQGVPIGYAGDPPESYLGKLLSVYEVLGGNPGVDLRVRLPTDPVFMLPGDEVTSPHTMSNGEAIGGKGLSDADSAELVRSYRASFNDTIYRRFDALERKIRRAVDYADQLEEEIAGLKKLVVSFTAEDFATVGQISAEQFQTGNFSLNLPQDGSLANLESQIRQLIADPNYRALTTDAGENAELGLDVYAPFSAYDIPEGTGQDPSLVVPRVAESPQRQGGKVVQPGQRKA